MKRQHTSKFVYKMCMLCLCRARNSYNSIIKRQINKNVQNNWKGTSNIWILISTGIATQPF